MRFGACNAPDISDTDLVLLAPLVSARVSAQAPAPPLKHTPESLSKRGVARGAYWGLVHMQLGSRGESAPCPRQLLANERPELLGNYGGRGLYTPQKPLAD